ncbi:hypothetical protein NPIL_294411 [Nephila pilipes]|uniref:Uncharacterized protein n=1 Tax=Nephila pilipes TaxID=299642 RepID=A0A8X6TRT7_NEPPI|nr:hypothetical protein NPIL_294411 [Nephila pilipes]
MRYKNSPFDNVSPEGAGRRQPQCEMHARFDANEPGIGKHVAQSFSCSVRQSVVSYPYNGKEVWGCRNSLASPKKAKNTISSSIQHAVAEGTDYFYKFIFLRFENYIECIKNVFFFPERF